MKRKSARIVLGQIQTLYTLGTLGGLSEAQLLELFLTRDDEVAEDAFTALVHRHGPMVLGVCRRMLPGAHDAEDAFQATFLILARRAASIGRREQLANWLHGVAIRTAKEVRRRAARQHARERRLMNVSKPDVENAPAEYQGDLLSLLDEELNRLPPRYRIALVVCELEGKSRHDAATQLGLPEGTLSTHLARGRKLLRERLLRRGVSLGVGPFAGLAQPVPVIDVPERLAVSTIRAALGYATRGMAAGKIPETVASLADGVLKMMLVTRSAVMLASMAAVGLAAVVAWAAVETGPIEPKASQPQVAPKPDTPAREAHADQANAVPRGARVQGIVVEEAGKPVAGIEVRVNNGNAVDRQLRGVTNTSGQFDFRISSPKLRGTILAASADRTRQGSYQYGYGMSADETKQPLRIVLKPAHEVAVRVVDREGKPVTNAVIACVADMIPVDGRTQIDGGWTVRVPADTRAWAYFARKANVGFDYAVAGEWWRGNGQALKPLPDQLTLTLDGAKTVRVKAVDRDGKPLAGVNVGLSSIRKKGHDGFSNWFSVNAELWPVTDKDGIAVLDWLPEEPGNGFQLGEHAEGLYAFDNAWIQGDRPVDRVTITFLPFETLSGRVTHADGRPAAGIVLSVCGKGPADLRGRNEWNGSALTDADGRYQVKARSEQAYVVAVNRNGDQWTAPYRADIIVHAGKPVDEVDFVLRRPTRVHGRLTIGKEGKPAPDSLIRVFISQEVASDEVRINGKSYHLHAEMNDWFPIDEHGEYAFFLGPGEYRIMGPRQIDPVTLTIPAVNPPAEITQDIHEAPAPTTGPLAVVVVDAANRPVAGALVSGRYPGRLRWFDGQKTNEQGHLQVERMHTPLILHARSADGTLAVVTRIEAEASECRLVVEPVATATGRLLDLDGKVLEQKSLHYGIRIYNDEEDGTFSEAYGATVQTDVQGRFTLSGLVPGQLYHVSLEVAEYRGLAVTTVTPKGPGVLDLGDLRIDTVLDRPHVPPTPEKRTAVAFSRQASIPPGERKEQLLIEARREYTRPLLLFGRPGDATCIDLVRALTEEPVQTGDARNSQGEPPPASKLRWEFEVACLDLDQPGVRPLAEGLGVATGSGPDQTGPPLLVVLADDGSVSARFPLRLDQRGTLDRRRLSTFLLGQKLPTRDAEKMLADALLKAKVEDKRVFLIFSASWCRDCRRLTRLLDSQKAELDRYYVFVKLDNDRDQHAESLRDRYPESKNTGIPWYAILDATGKELINSSMKQPNGRSGSTNVANLRNRREIDHFIKILKQTAPGLAEDTLSHLRMEAAKEE